jgi:predicted transcriptional regulator with HTH domain
LEQLDPNQLAHVNRYTIVKTDKNSQIVIDETENNMNLSFQNGTGELDIDTEKISITHVNDMDVKCSNNINISSGSQINITSPKIELDFGQFQKSASAKNLNYETFSMTLDKYKTAFERLNEQIRLSTSLSEQGGSIGDTITQYDQILQTLSKIIPSENSLIKVTHDKDKQLYTFYIKSVDTYIDELKQEIQSKTQNVQQTLENMDVQYEETKDQLLDALLKRLNDMDIRLNQILTILAANDKTNTQLYQIMDALKDFTQNLREQLSNG